MIGKQGFSQRFDLWTIPFLLNTEDSTDLQRRDIHGRLRERTSREAVARW